MTPLVVYDDRCRLCTSFARAVGTLAGGRIPLVGHYTELGAQLRAGTLGGDSALEMFWVVGPDAAHGGRAALLPLLRAVLSCRSRRHAGELGMPPRLAGGCGAGESQAGDCGAPSAVFARSASLLTRSQTRHARGAQGRRR